MRPASPTTSLARVLERWAARSPGRTALHFQGEDLTYARLWQGIADKAARLEIGKGDRVAWLGYNSPEMLVLLFALALRGAILVPLNWRLTVAEHRTMLADCQPAMLVAEPEFEAHAAQLQDLAGHRRSMPGEGGEDDDLLIVYTSGTTGRPKGAVLRQSALLWNARNGIHAHALTEADHILTALPMFHVGGLNNQTLPALVAGGTVTLQRRFDPAAWLSDVAARRPTISLLVPAAMQAVIGHPDWARTDLSSLRMLNCGSMVVPDSLIRAFHARGIPVGQIYGCTETAPIATVLLREDAQRKLGSAGKPAPHCEVRVVEGEIQVRGPNVMRAYWNDPAGTAAVLDAEGWFRTGDLARIDDEGYYWVMGRSKDVIISGGENIYPAEIENVLADCAEISESAVIGVPDEKWGETALAFVVKKKDSTLNEQGVLGLFKDRLANYKHPRRVVFLDRLPRNAMGKVQKFELNRLIS